MNESSLKPVRVRIRNFQSIEDVNLEIRGFTCITGPTNIGKSAIMRAIGSAVLNKPVGGLVRSGAGFSSVEISSESGWGFHWEKGDKGVNRCTIGGKTFDKTGKTQLPEIAAMGFKSIELGNKEVHPWWARQFFPLFLIDETGPAVTDFISKVSRLTVLQDAISLSNRGKMRSNEDAKRKAEQAQALRDRIAKVDKLDSLIRLQKELSEQVHSIRDYEEKILLGQKHFDTISTSNLKLTVFQNIESVQVPVDDFSDSVKRLIEMSTHYRKCESFAKQIIIIRDVSKVSVPTDPSEEYSVYKRACGFSHIEGLKSSVEVISNVDKVEVPESASAEEAAKKLNVVVKLHQKLESLSKSVQAVNTKVKDVGDVPEVGGLRAMQDLNVRMVKLRNDILQFEEKVGSIDDELAGIESKISQIPTCTSCGRPSTGSDEHSHDHAPMQAH